MIAVVVAAVVCVAVVAFAAVVVGGGCYMLWQLFKLLLMDFAEGPWIHPFPLLVWTGDQRADNESANIFATF